MAAVSALVLAVLAMFITNEPRYAFAVTSSSSVIAGNSEHFYGKAVTDAGAPIAAARVTIFDETVVNGKKLHRVEHVLYTNSRGLWYAVYHERTHPISVQFITRIGTRAVRSNANERVISPGHAYKFSVKLVKRTTFVFFPFSTY